MQRRALPGLALGVLASPAILRAQPAWPGRTPVRVVITFPPGGLADTVARLIAPGLGTALGGTVVIDNRAGAGGTIGADLVAKAAPDGFTLIVSHASPHGIAPGIYPQLPYDPVGDFTHLAMLVDTGNALMVTARSPLRTLADLRAAAETPTGVRYGSSGVGSITHLMGEVLGRDAGLKRFDHIAYRGSAPALQDLLGGQIETLFDPVTTYTGMLRDGTLRALAVSTAQRVPALPDVPTFVELGLPGLTNATWIGLSGPRGLPPAIAARLTEEAVRAVEAPSIRERLADLASYPPTPALTGAAYARFIGDYVRQWTAVARAAGIVAG